jgi:thymidine phosphorylase
VAKGAGLPTTALITDMNQVLGRNAGNALEVREAIDYLTASEPRNPRLHEVVPSLGAQLLLLGTLVEDVNTAREKLLQALESGAAAERFAGMITALGGPVDLVDQSRSPSTPGPVHESGVANQGRFCREHGYPGARYRGCWSGRRPVPSQ